MGVFLEIDKKIIFGYEIVGFEVVFCSVKRDFEEMSKFYMYDSIILINCFMEFDKC